MIQEKIVYVGQLDCYEMCTEVLEKLIGIKVGSTQIYRLTDLYGNAIEDKVNAERTLAPLTQNEVLYAQADGSMVLTREEGWKEVKVGRIFKSSDCIHAAPKQGWISNSQYVAHLGNCKDFSCIMDNILDSFGNLDNHLIFLSDGATWIRNWIEDAFPKAISILDYYHACEHLHQFSSSFFQDKKREQNWTNKQKELLLTSNVLKVIKNIRTLCKGTNEDAEKLIAYYQANAARMDYQQYKQMGCGIIGSGAIESAHRTVIQKRMKLSGQRWSKKGAQNMLNLRVLNKNHQWSKIIEISKYGCKAAA